MATAKSKLAILVGGGPAPGINSVIAAATIRAVTEGIDVVGIHDGFRWIMQGDVDHVEELTINKVSRIHFRGGSFLGTARDNPTKKQALLETTLAALKKLGIDKLITIGGDDTAFSAMKLAELAGGTLSVVHVPKTIDNDIDLPDGTFTFGFQTARHLGVALVKNLMIDARTTSRCYIVISMGRKAGHLALGVGKSVGAAATIIPEEFSKESIRLQHIADIIIGMIIKRLSVGRSDSVVVLAEGLMERLDHSDMEALATAERDEHGHIRLGEIHFAPIIKHAVLKGLSELGMRHDVTAKTIGYELRCADPIPYDMEYTRDLGYCAAQFVINGGGNAIISIVNGRFKPLYFEHMVDPETNRTRIRMVDIRSEYYHIARRYMLRLNKSDFENPKNLRALADVCAMTPEAFRARFEYLIEEDLLYKVLEDEKSLRASIENVKSPL